MHLSVDDLEFRPDIRLSTTELASIERLKDVSSFLVAIDPILFELKDTCNKDLHNFLDEFQFWTDLTTDCCVCYLERPTNSLMLIVRHKVYSGFSWDVHPILLMGTEDMHLSLDEYIISAISNH